MSTGVRLFLDGSVYVNPSQGANGPWGYKWPTGPYEELIDPPYSFSTGSWTQNQPVTPAGSKKTTGVVARTFFEDFYFHVHFEPVNVALGQITGDTPFDVIIWSAFPSRS